MTVIFNQKPVERPAGDTLAALVAALTPYGDEPVIVLLNGKRIESDAAVPLSEGDDVAVFPLLIGG